MIFAKERVEVIASQLKKQIVVHSFSFQCIFPCTAERVQT